MRLAIALGLALWLAGCSLPGGGGAPQTLSLRSEVTVPVKVRVGRFIAGEASVSDQALVGETPLNPRGSAEIDLAPGKYTLDAVADSPDKEVAVTTIEILPGRPRSATLVEHFELYKKSNDPAEPTVNKRMMGWAD